LHREEETTRTLSIAPKRQPDSEGAIGSCLQVVSKPQIGFEGKAQPDEKAEHIQLYVSILKKAAM
jgi:hypothetical protein